jgi:aspartate aminotransferase-like enzyme
MSWRDPLPFDVEDNTLLLPGPVKIHPRILRAMQRPAVGHRSPEFKQTLRDLTRGLRYLFQTKNPVFLLSGSATLGLEGMISCAVRPGEKILVLSNGKFGERLAQLAQMYAGDGAVVVQSPMGQPLDLARAESILDRGGVKAVAAVLNESSAGVRNPGAALSELCRAYKALFLADAVTAAGGMEVPVDDWGIDACVAGSQKCLGAPAGATLMTVSERYLESAKPRGLYTDVKKAAEQWAEEETPFTPATHLYFAVAEALEMLAEETLPKRIERTGRLARATRAALGALRVPLLPPEAIASDTITAARYPAGVGEKDVREVLKQEFGVVLAGGQGELKGQIFRIGHMGYVQVRDLLGAVGALEVALARTDHGATLGAGVSAFLEASTGKASP